MYIVRIPPSRVLTLPDEFKDFVKKGDQFLFSTQGDTIFIKKIFSGDEIRALVSNAQRDFQDQ
jgi:hypothetical protein